MNRNLLVTASGKKIYNNSRSENTNIFFLMWSKKIKPPSATWNPQDMLDYITYIQPTLLLSNTYGKAQTKESGNIA